MARISSWLSGLSSTRAIFFIGSGRFELFEAESGLLAGRFQFAEQRGQGLELFFPRQRLDAAGQLVHAAGAPVARAGFERVRGPLDGRAIRRLLGGQSVAQHLRRVVEVDNDHVLDQFVLADPAEAVQRSAINAIVCVHEKMSPRVIRPTAGAGFCSSSCKTVRRSSSRNSAFFKIDCASALRWRISSGDSTLAVMIMTGR